MRIQSTSNVHQSNLKCLVYGKSGIGKTTLASTLEGPTLIISAESGLASLHGTQIDFVDITQDDSGSLLKAEARIAKLREVYEHLLNPETQEQYNTVFLDSLTEIADIMKDYLFDKYPDAKDTFKLWGEYTKEMSKVVRAFRDLPHYHVVFTCLEDESQDDSKAMHYGPSLTGTKAKQMLVPMFDEVFRYTIHEDKRILVTSQTASSIAKDRSGKLSLTEAPNLQAILNRIKGEK